MVHRPRGGGAGALSLLGDLLHLGRLFTAAGAEQFQAFGENLLEVLHAAPFEQHVPVRSHRFGVLGLLAVAVSAKGSVAAEAAFPFAGDLRLGREGDREAVAPCAVVGDFLPGSQVGVAVVLVARRPEPGAAKCSLGHRVGASRRSCGLAGCNASVHVKIPRLSWVEPLRWVREARVCRESGLVDPSGDCDLHHSRGGCRWLRAATRVPGAARGRITRTSVIDEGHFR